MNRRLVSVTLAACVLALTAVIPVTPSGAVEMEYFPLAPGSYLIYNSTDDVSSWNTKRYIDEEWEFLGGPFGTFTIHWAEAHMMPGEEDYTWVNHMWLSKSSDTVLWWGFEDEFARIVCSKPLRYVTEPVQAGAVNRGATKGTLTLKDSGTTMQGVDFAANYTIDAIETVVVPAGTFNDCIKVHEEEITPDGEISFWVWYAPNVGAVQYYYPQADNRWDVLFDYEIDLDNDPWNSWLMPQLPTYLTITVIAVAAVVGLVALRIALKRRS
jgi:hypothetical protein